MKKSTLFASALAAVLSTSAIAQDTAQDHEKHHPKGAAAETQPAPPASSGNGMGMMGSGGMMDMSMMKDHMQKMRDHMDKMKDAKASAERNKMMSEQMDMMMDHMDMMMKMMDMMGGGGMQGGKDHK